MLVFHSWFSIERCHRSLNEKALMREKKTFGPIGVGQNIFRFSRRPPTPPLHNVNENLPRFWVFRRQNIFRYTKISLQNAAASLTLCCGGAGGRRGFCHSNERNIFWPPTILTDFYIFHSYNTPLLQRFWITDSWRLRIKHWIWKQETEKRND